jgi:hypothetical protein
MHLRHLIVAMRLPQCLYEARMVEKMMNLFGIEMTHGNP